MTVIAALLAIQNQTPPKITAAGLISKAFARYADAKSLVGRIRLTQTANGVSVTVDTQLQFETPSKFFLLQRRNNSEARQWLITSDGKQFSYNKPDGVLGHDRYVEDVNVMFAGRPKSLTIRDIYLAGVTALGDRNAILDIAIGRSDDLRKCLSQWPSFSLNSRVHVNDVDAWSITGSYAESQFNARTQRQEMLPVGTFELFITEEGDIARYVVRQQMQFPSVSQAVINVTSTWDASLIVNGKTNPALFQVIK